MEIRDGLWKFGMPIGALSKKVDGGSTYNQMATEYGSDFADAWTELSASLPTAWSDYQNFKFTADKATYSFLTLRVKW